MKTLTEGQAVTRQLCEAGQSPWLDYISRDLLKSGQFKSLIDRDGILGVTSNPTIFHKAISDPKGSYRRDVKRWVKQGATTLEIYDALTVADIRDACDALKPIYERSRGEDGLVSLEVRPDFSRDAGRTVADARRLFQAVGRPNVMIKVPATSEGIEALRTLTGMGVSINVTLIFSLKQYQAVAQAYFAGLADLLKKGGDLSSVHSVASVFVSRYDTRIDAALAELERRETDADEKADLASLKGKAAIVNSKLIYREFIRLLASDQFRALQASGARIQRVLWGSTSVKNPAYSDLMYIENLVGEHTVNTMPLATLEALLDHGRVRPDAILENPQETDQVAARLGEWGFDLNEWGEKLQSEGLQAFEESFEALMKTIEGMRDHSRGQNCLPRTRYYLGKGEYRDAGFCARVAPPDLIERFFRRDASLWKTEEDHQKVIANRLGWLSVADFMQGKLYLLDELAGETAKEKLKDVVLLGMGGSSLASEVMSLICKRKSRSPRFWILDTTDPASIRNVERKLNLKSSLFIVSSKSGSTIETTSQFQYFYEKVLGLYRRRENGALFAGRHFLAITDQGSRLEQEARHRHFRRVFINPGDIGGRYSALSFFGLVPAALMGIDVRALLKSAREILTAAKEEKDLRRNQVMFPGLLLGALARSGADKVTFLTTPALSSFGAWLEQLIAESTGKEEKGVVPVDGEPLGQVSCYGKDRVFVCFSRTDRSDKKWAMKWRALRKAGFPVIEIEWPAAATIGAEFMRWEVITAVACMVMRVNPFDEPNVRESKDNTSRILAEAEREGRAPQAENRIKAKGIIPFDYFFSVLKPGDFMAMLAYIDRSRKTLEAMRKLQARMRDQFKVPVLAGFGPRYLHSIGQLYKGGPQKGCYLVFVSPDAHDAKIPHAKFGFSQLKQSQAVGDIQALAERQRPLLVIDLGKDVLSGLKAFERKLMLYFKNLPESCE